MIGPEILDLAHSDEFVEFFSNLGLGMLFFFAGYEIDFERIKGVPMKLGAWGWGLSVLLAYAIGGALAAAGIILSFLCTGSAMATTAIGTLIPILRDNGELKTRFGTYLLARRRVRPDPARHPRPLDRSPDSRGADPARLPPHRPGPGPGLGALRLARLAGKLGLDVLLGGFVAGMITRAALNGHELAVFEPKPTAVGFGFFVPFFFVTSGIAFDLAAFGSLGAILKLLMFFALFLVVRGAPALLLYRNLLSARDRAALAFYCATELPLVVAITTIAVATDHMETSTAAGLVGAAMLSTLIYPFVGLALRRGAPVEAGEPGPPDEGPAALGEGPVAPQPAG